MGTVGVVLERCVVGGIVRGMNFGLRPRLAAAETADMEGTEIGVDWREGGREGGRERGKEGEQASKESPKFIQY